MNVLVIHIHVTLMPTALTVMVVSHVTAMWGILEVVLLVKVIKYLINICSMNTSLLWIKSHGRVPVRN